MKKSLSILAFTVLLYPCEAPTGKTIIVDGKTYHCVSKIRRGKMVEVCVERPPLGCSQPNRKLKGIFDGK